MTLEVEIKKTYWALCRACEEVFYCRFTEMSLTPNSKPSVHPSTTVLMTQPLWGIIHGGELKNQTGSLCLVGRLYGNIYSWTGVSGVYAFHNLLIRLSLNLLAVCITNHQKDDYCGHTVLRGLRLIWYLTNIYANACGDLVDGMDANDIWNEWCIKKTGVLR